MLPGSVVSFLTLILERFWTLLLQNFLATLFYMFNISVRFVSSLEIFSQILEVQLCSLYFGFSLCFAVWVISIYLTSRSLVLSLLVQSTDEQAFFIYVICVYFYILTSSLNFVLCVSISACIALLFLHVVYLFH